MRDRRHGQAGFALIEVVVSAALLMVVAGGVLAGIDGPQAISGRNEARSEAASLAQQDQERLRSLPVSQLIGMDVTTPITVGSPPKQVTYSRWSKVVWIRDANDTGSCTVPANDTSGDYLKITSRVTAPGNSAPVQLDSLLTPPPGSFANTKGDLSVKLLDQLNNPVVGQSVSISGPQSASATTNSEGCAVFGLVEKGTYSINFSRGGWVDPAGVSNVTLSTSVTAGSTNVVSHNYAQAGTIVASVDTVIPPASTAVNSPAKAVTVSNGGIPTGTLSFAATVANQYSFTMNGLYPFPSGYAVWAGGCTSGDPTKYGKPGVSAAPAPGASVAVTVRQPAIKVSQATGVPGYGNYPFPAGVHVVYTSIDAGCNEKYSQTTTGTTPTSVPYPGVPYGNYKLCADQPSFNAWAQLDTFLNQVATGSTPTVPYKGNGSCP
jgi:type II secretory pathway pseudopilin PulG